MLSIERVASEAWIMGSISPPRIYQAQLFKTLGGYDFLIGRVQPEPFLKRWPTYLNEVYRQSFYSRDFPEQLTDQMLTTFKGVLDPDHPYEMAYQFGGRVDGADVKVVTGGYNA